MSSYNLATVLISVSLASTVWGGNIIIPRALQVRQGGDAFLPGTRQGIGSTCAASFGINSKFCADSGICYDPSIGDSCCAEGYPCGTGSFCLTKGFCCPDGNSPFDCAAAKGITLPKDFGKTSPTASTSTTSLAPLRKFTAPAVVTTSSSHVTSSSSTTMIAPSFSAAVIVPGSSFDVIVPGSSSAVIVPGSSSAVIVPGSSSAPYPIPNRIYNASAPSVMIFGTGAPTGSSNFTLFTGAASPRAVVGSGALILLLTGFVAVL